MSSLDGYCQGVVRYRIVCQASTDTAMIQCEECGLRLWRCSATDTLMLHFTQVGSKLPAQSTLRHSRFVKRAHWSEIQVESRLQKQAATTASSASNRTRTLTLSLHHHLPRRQSCAPNTHRPSCRRRTEATRSTTLRTEWFCKIQSV